MAKKKEPAKQEDTQEEITHAEESQKEESTAETSVDKPADTKPEPVASADAELVYLNKTVTGVNNAIINGKSYKDVSVASGETFRLTPQEFERDVAPRA
jgi:hypothetical protein